VTWILSHAAAVLAALAATAFADEPPPRRAEVTLVSETAGAPPSGSFWVGLQVALRPGWHTYWINPGDSGAPARVTWTLPPGVVAGDIVWPAPHRLPNPPFVDFGYEDRVLLLVPLEVSKLDRGGSLSLAADVRLLVCRDVCVPERSAVTLTLPVRPSPETRTDVQGLFAAARRRVPGAPPASWSIGAEARDRTVILTIEGTPAPRALEFFPLRPLEIQHAAPQPYRRLPQGGSLTLDVDERRREPPSRLTGVLVHDDARSVAVDVPVSIGSQR
jgi:thiol:disulfide interchange protein DsbD